MWYLFLQTKYQKQRGIFSCRQNIRSNVVSFADKISEGKRYLFLQTKYQKQRGTFSCLQNIPEAMKYIFQQTKYQKQRGISSCRQNIRSKKIFSPTDNIPDANDCLYLQTKYQKQGGVFSCRQNTISKKYLSLQTKHQNQRCISLLADRIPEQRGIYFPAAKINNTSFINGNFFVNRYVAVRIIYMFLLFIQKVQIKVLKVVPIFVFI